MVPQPTSVNQQEIHINGSAYTLCVAYQNQPQLREQLNAMTRTFWGFDFENYYQSGYWDNSCQLYSLFKEDKILANTTVSLFTSSWDKTPKTLLQIGTVMTDEAWRNRGLSRFLMEHILKIYSGKTDGILLFANETVYDFYPKFGLVPVQEYQAVIQAVPQKEHEKNLVRPLNFLVPEDLRLFEQAVQTAVPNSAFPLQSQALPFFYCVANPEFGFSNAVYYVETLQCVVVMQEEEGILYIHELFAPQEIGLHQLITALTGEKEQEIRLGFTPLNGTVEYQPYEEDDLRLFVSENLHAFFENQPLMVPVLSHT